MNTTLAIICQINAIGDYVADGCLSATEMQKILDAIEIAHSQIARASDRIKRGGTHPGTEGMFG